MKWLAFTLALLFALPVHAEENEEAVPDPIKWSASAYGAGFGYANNSYRTAGGELQLRTDVWQGVNWSAHLAFTPDVFAEKLSGVSTTASFNDLLFGGTWTPNPDLPIWIWGEAHGLLGSSSAYGDGGGLIVGAAGRWKWFTLEVGIGGVFLEGDDGLTASGKLTWRPLSWFSLAALGLVTMNHPVNTTTFGSGGSHGAFGAEVKFGPFSGVTIDARWLGGQRVLALEDSGTVVENLPDTMRDTISLRVDFPIAKRWVGFVGGSFRLATETSGNTYDLGSGFAGVTWFF